MKYNRPNKYLLVLVLLIAIIFGLSKFSWTKKPINWAHSITAPAEKSFYMVGAFFSNILNYKSILRENSELRQKLSDLSVDYIMLNSLISENNYLREELNFLNKQEYIYQLANVIGRLTLNNQILIIDQGASSGLKVGQAAAVNKGNIVGKIIKVEENRSWVELLTSPDSKLAVGFIGLFGTNGLLVGEVGNNLIIDQIPQNISVNQGELVITSGLEEEIPRGMLVGEVLEEENIAGKIFKRVRIKSEIDFQNPLLLTIIKKN